VRFFYHTCQTGTLTLLRDHATIREPGLITNSAKSVISNKTRTTIVKIRVNMNLL
jgi:hypothetical protein